jgi:phenylacetate-CoA ligase
MPLEEMQKFQLKALRETVKWVYERIPLYKNTFEDMGLEPGDVKFLDDVRKLPFTGKTDLLDNYPFGLCTVPMSEGKAKRVFDERKT